MFGYVRTDRAELKVREDNYYRGAYCGLCRAMGSCTGQCSRMALNYDFVFLALIRLSLNETEVSFAQKRCLVHPLTRRNVMLRNAELDYAAAAAAILSLLRLIRIHPCCVRTCQTSWVKTFPKRS